MAGATRAINPTTTPLTLFTGDCNPRADAIRSFTVGNQTTLATVYVYLGSLVNGGAYYKVTAGSNITLPCQDQNSITFVVVNGQSNDGTIFLHVDSAPLSASGFPSGTIGANLPSTNGYATLPGGVLFQWGEYDNPPLDGTPFTIPFPTAFVTAVFQFVASFDSNGGGPWIVSPEQDGLPTLTGAPYQIFGQNAGTSGGKVRFFVTGI